MKYSDYLEHVAKLKEEIPGLESDIFLDFEDAEKSEDLLNIFSLGMSSLSDKRFIESSNVYFYFSNDLSNNARAGKNGSNIFIALNLGLLKKIDCNFVNNDRYIQFIKNNFNSQKVIDKIEYGFISAILLKFSFYHEYAHIIQFEKSDDISLNEQLDNNSEYSFDKHVLEYDADNFAAYHIGSLLMTEFGFEDDKLSLNECLELVLATYSSIFVYISFFYSNTCEFYTNKFEHPHAMLRNMSIRTSLIQYIMIYFTKYYNSQEEQKLRLDEECLNFSLALVDELNPNFVDKFKEIIKINFKQIVDYENELTEELRNLQNSALKKWNELSKLAGNSI